MRDWDSNTNHRMQWLFNEVPHKEGDIADGKDFFSGDGQFSSRSLSDWSGDSIFPCPRLESDSHAMDDGTEGRWNGKNAR